MGRQKATMSKLFQKGDSVVVAETIRCPRFLVEADRVTVGVAVIAVTVASWMDGFGGGGCLRHARRILGVHTGVVAAAGALVVMLANVM